MSRYPEKAYQEVLRAWCKHTPELLEKLRVLTEPLLNNSSSSLDGESLDEYTIAVHGMKGSTYGICADKTAGKAAELEDAARRSDTEFIAANTGPLIEEAEKLLQNLEKLLACISSERSRPKLKAKSPDPGLLIQFLDACIHFKSSRMEEILGELEESEYESGGDLVEWLRDQTDNLEYDAIKERLTEITA